TVLDEAAAGVARARRHAPLGLGPALSGAGVCNPRLPHLRRAPRDTEAARVTAGDSRGLPRKADFRRKAPRGPSDAQARSARDGFGGGPCPTAAARFAPCRASHAELADAPDRPVRRGTAEVPGSPGGGGRCRA